MRLVGVDTLAEVGFVMVPAVVAPAGDGLALQCEPR